MSRSEHIPAEVPDKFKPLTLVKRGPHNTRLPHRFADTCAALARPKPPSIDNQEETR